MVFSSPCHDDHRLPVHRSATLRLTHRGHTCVSMEALAKTSEMTADGQLTLVFWLLRAGLARTLHGHDRQLPEAAPKALMEAVWGPSLDAPQGWAAHGEHQTTGLRQCDPLEELQDSHYHLEAEEEGLSSKIACSTGAFLDSSGKLRVSQPNQARLKRAALVLVVST